MSATASFVDIHCHLVPEIDDGAKSLDESLVMAEMAVDDGITTIIVTPHQLGNYSHNTGDHIRERTRQLQEQLTEKGLPLRVLPGGDVRIEVGMVAGIRAGSVMTLADRQRHILLELPHELYFPLDRVLDDLQRIGVVGILSHPERNLGLLKQPELVVPLVENGCLMQVTAGSLMGAMGPGPKHMAEWMIDEGLVHFLATDAHGPRSRRPLIRRAYERVAEMTDRETANDICCHNPGRIVEGMDVTAGRRRTKAKGRGLAGWFTWRKAG